MCSLSMRIPPFIDDPRKNYLYVKILRLKPLLNLEWLDSSPLPWHDAILDYALDANRRDLDADLHKLFPSNNNK